MAEGPIDARITELERRLDKLRVAFEQHFMGNERLPPVGERDKFMRDLRALDPTKIAAVPRFRLANLTARVSTYDTYWQKTLRAIEEGTYARDKFKADLHARHRVAVEAPAKPTTPPAEPSAAPAAARARASEVADEASAFLASLRGAPIAPMPMRGAPVAPRGPATPTEAPPPVPMRGAPPPMRGAPVATPPAGKPPGESR